MKEARARDGVPVGKQSMCKCPEAGKRLVRKRARKKAAVAEDHRERRRWYEMRSDRQT